MHHAISFHSWAKAGSGLVAGLLLATAGWTPAFARSAPVTIYADNYAEGELMDRVARDLIEDHYKVPVTITEVDVGVAILGPSITRDSVMLDVWLPTTNVDYYDKVKDKVDTYGTSYTGASIGWTVPDYVPKSQLGSIADLRKPAVRKKLHSRIVGISAGAGEMRLSAKAVKAYGLSKYDLLTSSGPAMIGALKEAISHHQWIVVTAWNPHWIWERFHLRYLKDPKGVLGGPEHAVKIGNPKLEDDHPKVAAFFKRLHFSLDEINQGLAHAQDTSYDQAAKWFIKKHPHQVAQWLGQESSAK